MGSETGLAPTTRDSDRNDPGDASAIAEPAVAAMVLASVVVVVKALRPGTTRLQILRDGLEIIYWPAVSTRDRADDRVQAMVEMVMDEGAFGAGDGRFHSVKLLRDVQTGPTRLDHLDHAA